MKKFSIIYLKEAYSFDVRVVDYEVKLGHDASAYEVIFMIVLVCGVSSVSVLFASIKITDIEPKKLLRSM